MKRIIGAVCLFTVILAGTVAPRFASAHAELTEDEKAGRARVHLPEAPSNLQVEDVTHNTIRIGFYPVPHHEGHYHYMFRDAHPITMEHHRITLHTSPLPLAPGINNLCLDRLTNPAPEGCFREYRPIDTGPDYLYPVTITGLTPGTTYYVHVSGTYFDGDYDDWVSQYNTNRNFPNILKRSHGVTATVTTAAGPGTPTDPETPNPSGCSYKHRLTSVPATTGGGYTSQILISSEESNATATIRAFQSSNGNQIDVLDSAGNAISGSVSLAPTNSSKRFKLEGVQGWHTVIVEHPSERAMNRATVVMRLREPNGGVSIVPMEGVSDCVTVGTNTE